MLKPGGQVRFRPRARAAAFGRLCVETHDVGGWRGAESAAAFGRLCVETALRAQNDEARARSRLRAAVC